jgi:hypothetical protein
MSMMNDPSLTDRVLALFQQRFPREFEICVVTSQLMILKEEAASRETSALAAPAGGQEIEGQQQFDVEGLKGWT